MPKCALNQDTDSPNDWVGTDDDNWLMRWRIKRKHWFAFANRCPKGLTWTIIFFPGLYLVPLLVWLTGWSWWYLWPIVVVPVARKWRSRPIVLLAIKGSGPWRLENNGSTSIIDSSTPRIPNYYLSRIQKWCRWHFAILWPLCFQGHIIFKKKNVPTAGDNTDMDGKVFSFYRGWHFDEDEIYWGDGGGAGNYK